ncbi:MAG: MSHA pilin protein MshA [Colwellia sp.]|jgi:MSHA pilin protein MshA
MSSKGFTLIELIVVIVILGVLAVTAAPKFINLKADAQTSTLQNVQAAIKSASALVYGKSIVKGNHKMSSSITNSVNIGDDGGSNGDGELPVVYGYPSGLSDQFQRLLQLDSENADSYFAYKAIGNDSTTFLVYLKANEVPTTIDDACIVVYIAATAVGQSPTFKVNDCV